MANQVDLSVMYVADPTIGRPISNGSIYVGIVDLDPKIVANQKQISVLQENGTTVQVSQPISTSTGGVPLYNGSPVTIMVDGSYSLRIDDSTGTQTYYVPKNAENPDLSPVDTLADLKAITFTPDDGDVIKILGYYSRGDGAFGDFVWDATSTETDYYSMIVKVTAITTGRWKRLYTGGEGLPSVKHISWYGASPAQTDTVNTPAIQAAFNDLHTYSVDSYNYSSEIVFDIAGVYDINAELLIDVNVTDSKVSCVGFVRLLWTGATDNTVAMVRIKSSTTGRTTGLHWNGVNLFANYKAGYCVYAGGTDPVTTTSVSNTTWQNAVFEGATNVGFMGGDRAEPYVNDTDFSVNRFEHMTFYNSLYNVMINAGNAYITKFEQCNFGSNILGAVKQHLRLYLAGATWITQSNFTALTYPDATLIDGCYSIYVKQAGGISIRDAYSEDTRFLNTSAGFARLQDKITVENIYFNDARTTANGIDLSDSYSIYAPSGAITVKDSTFYSGGFNRKLYFGNDYDLSGVDLGAQGYVETTNNGFGKIEGMKRGQWKALNKNWDFSRWKAADYVMDMVEFIGAGGTTVLTQSTLNNVYGEYTAHLNTTVAATTFVSGFRIYAPMRDAGYLTCIMTGKLSADTVTPNITFSSPYAVGGTNIIIKDDLTFIAWAVGSGAGQVNADAALFFGIAPNVIGEMWIDTITLLDGRYTNGSHALLANPAPDAIYPSIHSADSFPTAGGTWNRDDVIQNNASSTGDFIGWKCITAGNPGVWESMGVLVP